MLRSLGPIRRLVVSPVVVRGLLVTNVVVQVAIVVTGSVVRLTGSGLGCTTAPECTPGRVTPFADQHISIHRAIEFGNRMLTTVVGLVALLTVIAVWRWGRRSLRGWAVLPLLLTLVQAVLGAITVRTGLNPWVVGIHFVLSALMIAAAAVLVCRARRLSLAEVARAVGRRPPRLRIPRGALLPVAFGAELAARISGREHFVTLDGVRMSSKKMYFSSQKASRELGYAPRPARHAIADAVAWFAANGHLR